MKGCIIMMDMEVCSHSWLSPKDSSDGGMKKERDYWREIEG